MRKKQAIGVLFLILLFIVGACAPSAAPTPARSPGSAEWDRIVEAAKKEGVVVAYTGWGADAVRAIQEGFTKTYGIKAEVLAMTGAEIREKVKTEQRAKAYVADVAGTGWRANRDLQELALHEPITVKLPAAQDEKAFVIPPFKYAPDRFAAVVSYQMTPPLLVNTEQVKEDIQSLYDLLNPKWKGRIAMNDPRFSGPGNAVLMANMGLEDFWMGLAKQDVYLDKSYDRVIDMAVKGEKAVAIGLSASRVLKGIQAGAPVKIVHPKEGTNTYIRGMGVIKNAPHPNAALVFINWLLSKEGQTAMHKAAGELVLRKDMTADWAYPAMRFEAAKKLIEPPSGAETDETRNKSVEMAQRIFGKP